MSEKEYNLTLDEIKTVRGVLFWFLPRHETILEEHRGKCIDLLDKVIKLIRESNSE